mgnify:CR=1 FL=1
MEIGRFVIYDGENGELIMRPEKQYSENTIERVKKRLRTDGVTYDPTPYDADDED